MCHGDRPITSRCSMTAHPKKKNSCHTVRAMRYWRAWPGSKTGSSVRSIGQQYTEEQRTGALAEAATTAAAAPATVPREYYTPPSPPCHRSPSVSSLWQHPPFSPTHRVCPELYSVSVPPSISSPRHPRTPHEVPETLLLPVSPFRPLSRVATPTT